MFNPFKKSKPELQASPFPITSAAQGAQDYLQPIVEVVEENWELPASEQFDHAFHFFMVESLRPIEAMEEDFANKQLLLRSHVQRMVEIAPDLFDKALRRTPYESGYLIEGGS